MHLPTLISLLPCLLPLAHARLHAVHPRAEDHSAAIAASQAKANATVVANLTANPLPETPSNLPAYHSNLSSYSSDTLPAVVVKAPASFLYGCATSAYQIEGSVNAGGRGESTWDAYINNHTGIDYSQKPGAGPHSSHVANNDTADVAVDFYNTYKEDIPLFKSALGMDTFSFSIAWTRILPTGKEKTANKAGVDYYKDVIAVTKAQGMLASCTLFHWDFPQALQAEYGGWLDDKIIDDYAHYVQVTMEALGNACDIWITVNEPRTFCTTAYGVTPNIGAPGLGVSPLEPFHCIHRMLLAHSRAHEIFHKLKGTGKVRGRLGIKVDGAALIPWDMNNGSVVATTIPAMDMGQMGWVVGPLTTGDYPGNMRKRMGDKLPSFTPQQSYRLNGSYDIIFWDAYATLYAKPTDGKCVDETNPLWPSCVELTSINHQNQSSGEATGSFWNFQGNDTIVRGLNYMHNRWGPKALAIGENGLSLPSASSLSLNDSLHDLQRIRWYRSVLTQINTVLEEGKIPLVGFLAWSCISNFEWVQGYQEDFGLIYAKPGTNQTRYVKESASFLQASFAAKGSAINTSDATRAGQGGASVACMVAAMSSLLVLGTLALF